MGRMSKADLRGNISLGHFKFEMPNRHPSRDVYKQLGIRVWSSEV